MPEKNQYYITEITDITAEGNGVCRIDGFVVFVPATATGDRVKIKIVKVLKNYAYGIVAEMITPSEFRTDPGCDVFGKCGGCVFRHITYEEECRIKDLIIKNAFRRIGSVDAHFDKFIPCEKIDNYRNKAQYPLAVIDGEAVCGFFAPRSHRVIKISYCPLQPVIFSDIVRTALEMINKLKIPVYDEKTGNGILRHIYLRQAYHTSEIMVCFIVRESCEEILRPVYKSLVEKFTQIKSVIMNINPDKTNVIPGKICVTLCGSDVIYDIMCGYKIQISPLSFYQVNTPQAEKLYSKALEYADPDKTDTVADLFCGAGTIGLSMAKYVKEVIGIEIVPEAIENAKNNAALNFAENISFFCGDAEETFKKIRLSGFSPDILITDPPRKGCSEETLKSIIESDPKKIVMISCDPSTAARDTMFLSKNGFIVEKISGIDLFPRTGHVETVVLMSRGRE